LFNLAAYSRTLLADHVAGGIARDRLRQTVIRNIAFAHSLYGCLAIWRSLLRSDARRSRDYASPCLGQNPKSEVGKNAD